MPGAIITISTLTTPHALPSFEVPYLMRFLKDRDINSLLLEISLLEAKNIAGQRSRIEAFAEMVQSS
jgi:hypothetical protein